MFQLTLQMSSIVRFLAGEDIDIDNLVPDVPKQAMT
jgi:hypothetical protein